MEFAPVDPDTIRITDTSRATVMTGTNVRLEPIVVATIVTITMEDTLAPVDPDISFLGATVLTGTNVRLEPMLVTNIQGV